MKIFTAAFFLLLVGCNGPGADAASPPQAKISTASSPHKMGPVAHVTLVNDARRALPARTVSFGQIFSPDSVRVGDNLQFTVEGRPLPTQTDSKALNADGSVRHAVMTVALPEMKPGQRLQAVIVNGQGGEAMKPASYVSVPALDVLVTLKQANGASQPLTVNLATVAADPKNATPGFWLNGSLAQERRFQAAVNDHLQVIFDVFTPASGPARVDVSFHNDWSTAKADDDVNYDVEMRLAGATVYKAQAIRQYPFTTWHRLIWSDGSSDLRVIPDLTELQAAAAVPHYDQKFAVAPDLLNAVVGISRELHDEPLSPGTLNKYMPTSGGRYDLGPLPTWAVVDLLAGSEQSRKLLLANADASGAVPWHIREVKTEKPLTADKYPGLWLDLRGRENEPLSAPFNPESNGWTIDDAHQPSLTYLPYLLTGSQYYRDELTQQTAFILLSSDAGYRGRNAALIIGEDGQAWEQVRGMAWSFRTIANAAYILPSDDPMQPYFDAKLKGNLAKLVQLYVIERRHKDAGEVEGWVPGTYRPDGWAAPWQQGYLAIVLGWINDMGYADAGRTLTWMSNFLAGPFTSGDKGYDPSYGPAYTLMLSRPDIGKDIATWAEVFKASELTARTPREKQDAWDFYGMSQRAGVGAAYAVTHSPKTEQAFKYISNHLGASTKQGDPTFAIVPTGLEQSALN